jgi:hypothetical protein
VVKGERAALGRPLSACVVVHPTLSWGLSSGRGFTVFSVNGPSTGGITFDHRNPGTQDKVIGALNGTAGRTTTGGAHDGGPGSVELAEERPGRGRPRRFSY